MFFAGNLALYVQAPAVHRLVQPSVGYDVKRGQTFEAEHNVRGRGQIFEAEDNFPSPLILVNP